MSIPKQDERTPGLFRKKPIVIEAFQFQPVWRPIGACADNAPIWFLQAEQDGKAKVWGDDDVPYCMIATLEGSMKASVGDWIIKGVKGEIYPCKPDIFAATYEQAQGSASTSTEALRSALAEGRRAAVELASLMREGAHDKEEIKWCKVVDRIDAALSGSSRHPEETGWVIEDGESEPCAPRYLAGYDQSRPGAWSTNHADAIRFARKVDAERARSVVEDGEHTLRICEHIWGGEKISGSPAPSTEGLREAARKAHDTLIEINPRNYDHDDVVALNAASVEAILLLADALGERHGKSEQWWNERRTALAGVTAPCEECGGHGGFESIVGFDAHGPSHQWTPCQPCGGTGSVFSGAAPSKEPPCIQRFSGRGLSSLEASKQAQTDKSEIEPDGRK